MTTFTDFVRDKHFDQYVGNEKDRNDDFDTWRESLDTNSLVGYLLSYNNSLSGTDYARFAYSILQSNN